jgi:uncharacterized coiled-coil protein SlyX
MASVLSFVPRAAIFIAGVTVGTLTAVRRVPAGADSGAIRDLKKSVADLEARVTTQEKTQTERFGAIETRLEEHTAKLANIPSTAQIVSAMEQLLSKTMSSLDERLSTQAHSIEVLKTTVSQTDSLLERVLESLDSLQNYSEESVESLLERPAV